MFADFPQRTQGQFLEAGDVGPYVLRMSRMPRWDEWMKRWTRGRPIDWRTPVEDVRRRIWVAARALEGDAPDLLEVRALTVAGAEGPLKARLYVPYAAGVTGPALVFFHGGGFVVGDLDSHDMICRRLAAGARVRVLSIAYRLAPENKFPCAVDDAIAATRWAGEHGAAIGVEPARLGVGGDSAGGNLAAVVAQQARRLGPALKAQMLIYPSTQWVSLTPSQIRFKQGHALTQAAQDFVAEKYLARREDAYDVRCSPLLENDLKGAPAAYVITAGLDPLRDEGLAYADKLAASGVAVAHVDYPDQPHGFFNMTAISATAKRAIEAAGAWLAKALA